MFAFAVRFNHALFLGFLLASAVLANSGGVHGSPKLLDSVERRTASGTTCDSNCWGGASWELDNGTFYYVTGTFNVPKIAGPDGSIANVFVSIDGNTCSSGVLVGVEGTVTDQGPTYRARWAWLSDWVPVGSGDFSTVPIRGGDSIKITINLFNTTAGFGIVENLSHNRSFILPLSSSSELCGQNAAWFIQSGSRKLASFSPVNFTDAVAGGQGNATYGLSGATILEKAVGGKNVTCVQRDPDSPSTWMVINHV